MNVAHRVFVDERVPLYLRDEQLLSDCFELGTLMVERQRDGSMVLKLSGKEYRKEWNRLQEEQRQRDERVAAVQSN